MRPLRSAIDSAQVLGADQVLVGVNRTRRAYNQRMRDLNGFNEPDPAGQLHRFREELMFADLEIVTNRSERLQDQLKKPRPAKQKEADEQELALLRRIQAALEAGQSPADLGLKPDEVMYVGDNPEHDVAPPKSVGLVTVWARRGAKRGSENCAIEPDHVVDDFGELASILRERYAVPLADAD